MGQSWIIRIIQRRADWGGSTGYFGTLVPSECAYHVVDGTMQVTEQTLADLRTYRQPADGVLLRHVLELNDDWRAILDNALASFDRRMVVVLHTPHASPAMSVKVKSGWPIWHLDYEELRDLMGVHLVRDESVQTTHPEHVFYLERAL